MHWREHAESCLKLWLNLVSLNEHSCVIALRRVLITKSFRRKLTPCCLCPTTRKIAHLPRLVDWMSSLLKKSDYFGTKGRHLSIRCRDGLNGSSRPASAAAYLKANELEPPSNLPVALNSFTLRCKCSCTLQNVAKRPAR